MSPPLRVRFPRFRRLMPWRTAQAQGALQVGARHVASGDCPNSARASSNPWWRWLRVQPNLHHLLVLPDLTGQQGSGPRVAKGNGAQFRFPNTRG